MQVFRHIPAKQQLPSAVTIGNFDGMHLGHQALLKILTDTATVNHLSPTVMTFEPHPREFFAPESAPPRLSSLREKLEHFAAAGIEKVYVCRFNRQLAKLSPQAFMQSILRDSLNADSILVGDDFRFGAMRAGSTLDFLDAKFNLISLPQVDLNGIRVSSTRVRAALASGNLQEAGLLLNRPYSMSGKVVHGAKLGRTLGFPTANVHIHHERPALTGVYAVKLDGLHGVANLGVRPTIGGVSKLMLEVHLLDFNADLYGKHVHVTFLNKIRDEAKFNGLDALKAQIAKDVASAKSYFETTIKQ